jgi:hypothetical protein
MVPRLVVGTYGLPILLTYLERGGILPATALRVQGGHTASHQR